MAKAESGENGYSELDGVVRRWPYVPEHVRRTVVELVERYGPPVVEVRFPTPAGATWADVELVLLSPEEVRVTVGAVTRSYSFAALGLTHRHDPERVKSEGRMLRTYGENPEPDAYYKLPKRGSLKSDISRFRRWLQGFFNIPGDPLEPFHPGLWLPKFKIYAEYSA